MTVPAAFLTSNSQLWMTPPKILKALAPEFNFVLDVCASPQSAKCPVWFEEGQDAFSKSWFITAEAITMGRMDPRPTAAWCNPPYGEYLGKHVQDWVQKAHQESGKGLTTVLLLPVNKQDQGWWHRLVEPYAEVIPVEGRIHFLDPATGKRPVKWSAKRGKYVQDGNSQGSVLVVFGPSYKPRAPRRSFVVPPDEDRTLAKPRTLVTAPSL